MTWYSQFRPPGAFPVDRFPPFPQGLQSNENCYSFFGEMGEPSFYQVPHQSIAPLGPRGPLPYLSRGAAQHTDRLQNSLLMPFNPFSSNHLFDSGNSDHLFHYPREDDVTIEFRLKQNHSGISIADSLNRVPLRYELVNIPESKISTIISLVFSVCWLFFCKRRLN
jgi:hypothetical protein